LNNGAQVNAPINDGYFKKAIINSQLTGEGIAVPLNPRFDDPGLNLSQYESLSTVLDEITGQPMKDAEGNPIETLTLKAQAITTDTGSVSYEWWYKPAEDSADGKFNSLEEVSAIWDDQANYFRNHCRVNHNVYTDSEGLSYNSITEF
jgi:hypothetical protein